MALTGKLKVFADAVFIGKSNKEAAILAGYSAATASPAGSRLVKDPRVVKYLAELRAPKPETPAGADSTTGAPPSRSYDDPKQFLIDQMNDAGLEDKLRQDAAKALLPFTHQKLGEGGKKEQKEDAAKKVASRFAPAAPPKLVAVGGKPR